MDKKILVLFNSYWFNKDVMSGGIVRLVEIFKRLNMRNLTCLTNQNGVELFQEYRIRAKFIVTNSIFNKLTIIPSYIMRTINALRALRKGDYDILYASSAFFTDVIPAYFKKNSKNVWVQCIFHLSPHWGKRKGNILVNIVAYYIQKISLYFIKRRADKVIVINNLIKNELESIGFNIEQIHYSPCGVDNNYLAKIERSNNEYDGVFLARLNYSKGIYDLIDVWKVVTQKIPSAKLAIIGGGNKRIKNGIIKRIRKLDLVENIHVLGFLENIKAYSILKSGKVFLFPSHEEGWGISIAEAMLCKVPVVSWDLPVYKEIFNNYTIQIEENNIHLFSETIVDLFLNDQKRKGIAEEGYKFAQKYSWENAANTELSILEGPHG